MIQPLRVDSLSRTLAGAALFCAALVACKETDCLELKTCVTIPQSTGGTSQTAGVAAGAPSVGGGGQGGSETIADPGDAGSGGEVANDDGECSSEGERVCADDAAASILECVSGFWVAAESCADGTLCNPTDASCAAIVPGCERLEPGAAYCDGNERVVCGADPFTAERQACEGRCVSGACVGMACGNGALDGDEECDDGNENDYDDCTSLCEAPICGDGLKRLGEEECDDGNDDEHDDCTNDCKRAVCGDGLVQEGFEECDDGNDEEHDECLSSCKSASCGDSVVQDSVEECDDGNDDDGDLCTTSCRRAICGDRLVQRDVEECDDGNENDGDGCGARCEAQPLQLALGKGHTCALLGDGRVKCWGSNLYGQVGNLPDTLIGDEKDEMGPTLRAVFEHASGVATGARHTCAIQEGSVSCWGDNSEYQLGPDSTDVLMSKVPRVVDVGGVATQVCAAGTTSAVLMENGEVKVWGSSTANPDGGLLLVEFPDDRLHTRPLAISCGDAMVCARYKYELQCWGTYADHQPGLREATFYWDNPRILDLSVGAEHACATFDEGKLVCFGWSSSQGALLQDPPTSFSWTSPVVSPVLSNAGGNALLVGAGGDVTCLLFDDNSLKCWGQDVEGSLGANRGGEVLGDEPSELGTGVSVIEVGTGLIALSVITSGDHTCALFSNGRFKCWGSNGHGELGIGSTESQGDDVGEMGEALPFVEIN
ncbi:MAG: DUF4215 domain-containing protein [Myxococcota bacterium]|nr:DUF4215 domain-containing protein [Myxococcota bacterium]